MGEQGVAEVVDHLLARPGEEERLRVAKAELEDQRQEEEESDPRKPGPVAPQDVGVDGHLRQVRLDEVDGGQERKRHRRQGDHPAIGSDERPQATHEAAIVGAPEDLILLHPGRGSEAAHPAASSRVSICWRRQSRA